MIDVNRIRQLLAEVPQPPGEKLPAGIAVVEYEGFEMRTGIQVPDDVREWLAVTNGPCVGPGGMYGIRPPRSELDIEGILSLFPSWINRKWLPVAGDGCGNYYIVPTRLEYGSGYPVLFIETITAYDAPAYIVASDIGHFLVALLEQEIAATAWPFNAKYVVQLDPEITRFTNVQLPWSTD